MRNASKFVEGKLDASCRRKYHPARIRVAEQLDQRTPFHQIKLFTHIVNTRFWNSTIPDIIGEVSPEVRVSAVECDISRHRHLVYFQARATVERARLTSRPVAALIVDSVLIGNESNLILEIMGTPYAPQSDIISERKLHERQNAIIFQTTHIP